MLVVDEPVDSAKNAARLLRQGSGDTEGGLAVDGLQNALNLLDRSHGGPPFRCESAADRAPALNGAIAGFFVGRIKEQLVLDDRAADIGAPVIILERFGDDRSAIDGLTGQAVGVVKNKTAAVKLVRAGLGDHVDRAAGKLPIFHVEG